MNDHEGREDEFFGVLSLSALPLLSESRITGAVDVLLHIGQPAKVPKESAEIQAFAEQATRKKLWGVLVAQEDGDRVNEIKKQLSLKAESSSTKKDILMALCTSVGAE